MKLTDQNPSWASKGERQGVGLFFRCPHCAEELVVFFANPLDSGPPSQAAGRPLWQREGDTFETLTLTPSIDSAGHWHGWVRGGEIINAGG